VLLDGVRILSLPLGAGFVILTSLGNFFASCEVLFPGACKGKACYFIM
jgi:hypothetical protein